MTIFTKSLLVVFEFFFFFLSRSANKFNADKNHSQPPGKCHLHSDADRGTDKIACRGDALADGNLRWDRANEQLEILQRNGQNNPQSTR